MLILVRQMNPTIADIEGNSRKIIEAIKRGKKKGASLVLFPEMALSGYPPEDFLLLDAFIKSTEDALEKIIPETRNMAVILGLPRRNPDKREKHLYNSAAILSDGNLLGFQDKVLLPTYDVFDERRYFESGKETKLWQIQNKKIAVTICEDIWQHSKSLHFTAYERDPVEELSSLKPDLLLNLSASPFHLYKTKERLQAATSVAKSLSVPLLLCNQVGGNDSLIFDGHSLYIGSTGLPLGIAKGFMEDDFFVDLEGPSLPVAIEENEAELLYQALTLGIKDYFHKLRFKSACLGLSGGIDSAVVACLACQALGKENVLCVTMPSRFTSDESTEDSKILSKNLGTSLWEIPIEKPFKSYLDLLTPYFEEKPFDATEENLQARIRGMILMAISNKHGYIVLSTGNKSELAMGYATLYGDMCGGLSVINDVTKEQVYTLAHFINRNEEIIPERIIKRAPSAELRPNQKDSDTLPDYAIVDTVLKEYIVEHRSAEEIAKKNHFPKALVLDLIRRIHQNEYKRRQSPPGLRISEKAFSIGRRFPIVQGWI